MGKPAEPRRSQHLIGSMLVSLSLTLVMAGCSDSSGPELPIVREVGVVLNSVDISLTVFGVNSQGTPFTIGLAPDGSPVSMAVRGSLVAVPLGLVPAVAVVDLTTGLVTRTVALPEGSGATGAAFLDDERVMVANPGLGSVSVVNVVDGTLVTSIDVGVFPQGVIVHQGRAFVFNGELGPDFLPTGPGTITVLDVARLEVLATIDVSGENPSSGAVGPDGRIYVVNAGRFFGDNGSVSMLDGSIPGEVDWQGGFGDFPGAPAFGPEGDLYVPAFSYGVAIWSPVSGQFVRATERAIEPEGVPSASGLGFDAAGRLYTLRPDCVRPSAILRLSSTFEVEATMPVGVCPIAVAFTEIPEG
ncbi:MAG: hypothetical protein BMS9Abin29_2526 [Gemmatimonadota bacterium]|nr:MAG: hypothetical protein BMS9Abin29_2526 [Gemmatimonadota bacterium]